MPVKTCSTKAFCKPLNAEYICQYKFAEDGSLCKNNSTGASLFAKLASSQLARMGLPSKPTYVCTSVRVYDYLLTY